MGLIFSFTFSARSASASFRDYLYPDYYLGKALSGVLLFAGKVGYQSYQKVVDPRLQDRADRSMKLIQQQPAFKYRFKKIKIILVKGNVGEPNAFSLGATILLTKSMGDLLTDSELTAVLAHELAHSQKAHLAQRMPAPLGAAVLEFYNYILSGEKLNKENLEKIVAAIREQLDTVNLATELQADCLAAKQLDYLKQRGLANHAQDLVSATNAIYGFDVTELQEDYGDPGIIRAKYIKSNAYKLDSCAIF